MVIILLMKKKFYFFEDLTNNKISNQISFEGLPIKCILILAKAFVELAGVYLNKSNIAGKSHQ